MSSPKPQNRGRRFLLWSFGLIVAFSLTLVIGIVQLFRIDRTDAKVRDEFIRSIDAPVHSQVQIHLGPALLVPARLLAGLITDLPPEARLALSAARRASIGVYTVDPTAGGHHPNALFDAAARGLPAQDWNRVAVVRDGEDTVMVYLPRKTSPGKEIPVRVAVFDGQGLVLVSASLRPGPLIEIASRNLPDFLRDG